MKKSILKISLIVSILVIILGALTANVNASEYQAKDTVSKFLNYLEYGSSYTLNCVDSHNATLYSKAQDRLNSYTSIDYEIKKVTQKGNTYKVEAKIAAKGVSWEVNGLTATFDVEYVNGEYRITDTNFFDITSGEYIAGMTLGIITVIFLVMGIISVGFVVVIIVVIVIVVKKNKNK